MKSEVNVSFRLDSSIYEEAKKVAKRKGLTFSSFIRMILIEAIEKEKEKEKEKAK